MEVVCGVGDYTRFDGIQGYTGSTPMCIPAVSISRFALVI
jgi:hypothetical protein